MEPFTFVSVPSPSATYRPFALRPAGTRPSDRVVDAGRCPGDVQRRRSLAQRRDQPDPFVQDAVTRKLRLRDVQLVTSWPCTRSGGRTTSPATAAASPGRSLSPWPPVAAHHRGRQRPQESATAARCRRLIARRTRAVVRQAGEIAVAEEQYASRVATAAHSRSRRPGDERAELRRAGEQPRSMTRRRSWAASRGGPSGIGSNLGRHPAIPSPPKRQQQADRGAQKMSGREQPDPAKARKSGRARIATRAAASRGPPAVPAGDRPRRLAPAAPTRPPTMRRPRSPGTHIARTVMLAVPWRRRSGAASARDQQVAPGPRRPLREHVAGDDRVSSGKNQCPRTTAPTQRAGPARGVHLAPKGVRRNGSAPVQIPRSRPRSSTRG